MAMKNIRDKFKVPAYQGARVIYYGNPGVIRQSDGLYINIKLDGDTRTKRVHPKDERLIYMVPNA